MGTAPEPGSCPRATCTVSGNLSRPKASTCFRERGYTGKTTGNSSDNLPSASRPLSTVAMDPSRRVFRLWSGRRRARSLFPSFLPYHTFAAAMRTSVSSEAKPNIMPQTLADPAVQSDVSLTRVCCRLPRPSCPPRTVPNL